MMSTKLDANASTVSEVTVLKRAAEELPADSPVRQALQIMLNSVLAGGSVTVLEDGQDLSPNRAAELLGVSRPFLLKFMDDGALAYHRVGTHRRIKVEDLLDFADRRDRASKVVAESLAGTNTTGRQSHISDEDLDEFDQLWN